MVKKYLNWVCEIPLWKKIVFTLLSFVMSALFFILLSLFWGINLIIYTSGFLRFLIILLLKKMAGFLFLNKLFYKLAEKLDSG